MDIKNEQGIGAWQLPSVLALVKIITLICNPADSKPLMVSPVFLSVRFRECLMLLA
jgi:hypothetical protein